MPVVFVHGVPEAAAIWAPLLAELGRDDAITLSPPGFGAPVPDGFGATSDDYLAWLTGELAGLTGPVDLIGHDWGGGHVTRLAAARPDLIRSWGADVAGIFDPDYVWHDLARARGGGGSALPGRPRAARRPVTGLAGPGRHGRGAPAAAGRVTRLRIFPGTKTTRASSRPATSRATTSTPSPAARTSASSAFRSTVIVPRGRPSTVTGMTTCASARAAGSAT